MAISKGYEEEFGYRRGVVLGLTLAEMMLLLLFCILIASAAILTEKERQLQEAGQRERVLRDQIVAIDGAPGVGTSASPPALEELIELLRRIQVSSSDAPVLVEVLEGVNEIAKREEPGQFWRELRWATAVARTVAPDADTVVLEQILKVAKSLREVDPDAAAAIGRVMEQLVEREAAELHDLAAVLTEVDASGTSLSSLEVRAETVAAGGPGEHSWPPIIRLSDAEGYSFESGSAELNLNFEMDLRTTITNEVARLADEYDIDVIEVIGHTDEQRLVGRTSNLDDTVLPAVLGEIAAGELAPADNAGLGLARAIAVANVLADDVRLSGKQILPISAGQTTMPGDRLSDGTQSGDVPERRRIEIRLRRSAGVIEQLQ